ncbi:MAG: anti-sigma factor [Betaproteobacteria bacterium]|nr:anti-sigma factor [Betaproteobacteria bacterium]
MKAVDDISSDELMAYIDGELGDTRRQDVERAAQENPALAHRIDALREQAARLREAFSPVLDEPVPTRLLHSARPRRNRWAQAAMVAAALGLGAAVGSLTTRWAFAPRAERIARQDRPNRFLEQARLAYAVYTPDPRRPVEVRRRSALVTWLTRRMGRPIAAPDELPHGLELIGGRLLPGMPDHPAAQLMYQDAQGRRVTVYLRGMAKPTAPTAFRIIDGKHVTTLYWIDGNWGYALSGNLPRGQLLDVSRALYRCYAGKQGPAAE